jgi:phage baseplate assembly protein W
MTRLADIQAQFWQPALGSEGVVLDAEDINQCIRTILMTPKGSVPHRPWFGSDLIDYIDWPLPDARPHIVREAVDALRDNEPRIEVVRVEVYMPDPTGSPSQLLCSVEWRFTDAALVFVTNLSLDFT